MKTVDELLDSVLAGRGGGDQDDGRHGREEEEGQPEAERPTLRVPALQRVGGADSGKLSRRHRLRQ